MVLQFNDDGFQIRLRFDQLHPYRHLRQGLGRLLTGRLRQRLRAALPIAILPAAAVGLYELFFIYRNALDAPIFDDWSALTPEALPSGLTARWLLAPYSGHFVATTRLLVWLLYHLDHWNLRTHQMLNWLLYALSLAALTRTAVEAGVKPRTGCLLLALTLLLYPPIQYGWISTCNIALLCSVLAARLIFCDAQNWSALLIGGAAVWLAALSYGAGAIFGAAFLPAYVLFKFGRMDRAAEPGMRRREFKQLLCVALLIVGAFLLWALLAAATIAPEAAPLLDSSMGWPLAAIGLYAWRLATLICYGFGWADFPAPALVLLGAALAIIPPMKDILTRARSLSACAWRAHACSLGALSVLAACVWARGDSLRGFLNTIGHYKTFAYILPLLSAAGWHLCLEGARPRRAVAAALALFCAGGMALRPSGPDFMRILQRESLESARDYYLHGARRGAKLSAALPSAEILEAARKLKLSFFRRLESSSRAPDGARLLDYAWEFPVSPDPLYTGAGYTIRAYAGAPLISDLLSSQETLCVYPYGGQPSAAPPLGLVIFPRESLFKRSDQERASVPALCIGSIFGFLPVTQSIARRLGAGAPSPSRAPVAELLRRSPLRPARASETTPIFNGDFIEASLFQARRPVSLSVPSSAETLWLAISGEAEFDLEGRRFRSLPGTILRVPRGAGRVRVKPEAPVFQALRVRML